MQFRVKKDKLSRGKIKLVQDHEKKWVAYTLGSKVWAHLHGKDELEVRHYLVENGFQYKLDYRG